MIGDPRIKHVCFTGSVGGGRRIMAMAAANQTWSGLCSSVWSTDTEHAMTVAGQLRSGIGRERGRQGMHEFTETHVMAIPSEA
jgi:acyl-CoA reductase-like NAD-dependent aldehyde dehydrogenase